MITLRRAGLLITWLLLSLILGCANTDIKHGQSPLIIKSPNDTRSYESIVLKNQLQVLLISDSTIESAGAAISVGVGSFQNPKELPGLAHYLEHMLFLGTKQYPEPNSFQKFIEENAGTSNAFTAAEQTNYFFQVSAPVFDEALARFSDYFKAPTFDREYSNKERNAVNSEWSASRNQDGRIIQRIRGLTANKNHPLQNISVGNLETLKTTEDIDLYVEMLQFYQRYYSANNMKLVLFGKQDLAALKALAEKHFATVKNTDITRPTIQQQGLTKDVQAMHIYYRPQKPFKNIIIEFPITNNKNQWKAKPNYYVANILSSEEPNTVAQVLRKKGWVDYFTASASPDFYGSDGFFSITIGLTETGLEHEDEIIAAVFNYIELIRSQGINEGYYLENKAMLGKSFEDMQTPQALTQAIRFSGLLFDIPVEHIIDMPYFYKAFDTKAIGEVLQKLTPEHARIWHINNTVSTKATSTSINVPFYAGEYKTVKFTAEDYKNWSLFANNFSLPEENDLFSSDKAVIFPNKYKVPTLIVNQKGVEAWLMHSQYHSSEKAYLQVVFNTPAAHKNISQWIISDLVNRMFSMQTTALQDKAGRAGIGVGISHPNDNHTISLSGYGEKHMLLYQRMLSQWVNFTPNPQDFAIALTGFVDRINSLEKTEPNRQLFMQLNNLVKIPSWSAQEILTAAKHISIKDVQVYFNKVLQKNRVRIFAFGNYDEKTVKTFAQITVDVLGQNWIPQERYFTPFIVPTAGASLEYKENIAHTDNAFLSAYYTTKVSLDSAAQIALLNAMFHNAFYTKLRTEEQLGYIVGSGYDRIGDYWGFLLYIQSTNTNLEQLKQRFERFILNYLDELEAMDDEVLKQLQKSVIAQLNQAPGNFTEEYSRYLGDFYRGKDTFDSRARLVDAIDRVSKASIIALYKDLLLNHKGQKIQIQLHGKAFIDSPVEK